MEHHPLLWQLNQSYSQLITQPKKRSLTEDDKRPSVGSAVMLSVT